MGIVVVGVVDRGVAVVLPVVVSVVVPVVLAGVGVVEGVVLPWDTVVVGVELPVYHNVNQTMIIVTDATYALLSLYQL